MKPTTKLVDIQGGIEYEESHPMGFASEAGIAMALNHLISMYSNPYVAALREYTSNAYDSHLEAGQTRPVEVTIPSELQPNLIIRDYGVGMSKAQLIKYAQFGESSKHESDEQIGGFGIGSKSGLAMAPQFTATSVKNGKRNTVVVSRREDGHPVLNMLREQDAAPDEPNGVTITLPSTAAWKLKSGIQDQNMFMGWPENTITFKGATRGPSVYNTEVFSDLEGLGWIRKERDRIFESLAPELGRALVGPVLYNIKWSEMENTYPERLRKDYLSRIVIKLDIGSVDLTPSREELLYSARTRNAIKERVDAIIAAAQQSYQTQIDTAENARTALRFVSDAQKLGFAGPYTYKDKTLGYTLTSKSILSYLEVEQAGTSYRSSYVSLRMSDIDGSMEDRILRRKHVELVPEAGDVARMERRNNRHVIATMVTPYIRKRAEELGIDPENIAVVFVSDTLDEIPSGFIDAFSQVTTREKYEAVSKASRKEIMSRSRATRGSTAPRAPRPKHADVQVRVLTWDEAGHSWYREQPLNGLDTTKKYVLLKTDDPDLNGADRALSNLIRCVALFKSSYRESNWDARRLTSMLCNKSDYVILLANKTWNTKIYSETLQMVPIREALNDVIKSKAVSLTPVQVTAAKDRTGYRHIWATYFKAKHLEGIKRVETRDWLEAMGDDKISKAMDQYSNYHSAGTRYGLDVETLAVTQGLDRSPAERYPLLRAANHNIGSYMKEAVQYVNMIDEALDAEAAS